MAPRNVPRTEGRNSLALALVVASATPVLLLDGGLEVIAASASFCRAFQIDPSRTVGRSFYKMGAGEWETPQLRSLLKATAAGSADVEAYEMDLVRKEGDTRRLVINAQRLAYGGAGDVWLALSVLDVTDIRAEAKLKDDLVREKAVLLQELQHRVANSLQIIASVLLQSARGVQSDEARGHLHDAHSRVMSVATVQRQLSATRLGNVELRAYFTELCHSIAASMIHDPEQISLEVDADEAFTSADTSTSLGLIVTELVINALKHAFPGHRQGKVLVSYRSDGPNWTLSVRDDGVGMPPSGSGAANAGLGTTIVQALATQLNASIVIADSKPGTAVSIDHFEVDVEDRGDLAKPKGPFGPLRVVPGTGEGRPSPRRRRS